jgi:hypothetical protein
MVSLITESDSFSLPDKWRTGMWLIISSSVLPHRLFVVCEIRFWWWFLQRVVSCEMVHSGRNSPAVRWNLLPVLSWQKEQSIDSIVSSDMASLCVRNWPTVCSLYAQVLSCGTLHSWEPLKRQCHWPVCSSTCPLSGGQCHVKETAYVVQIVCVHSVKGCMDSICRFCYKLDTLYVVCLKSSVNGTRKQTN